MTSPRMFRERYGEAELEYIGPTEDGTATILRTIDGTDVPVLNEGFEDKYVPIYVTEMIMDAGVG